MKKNVFICLFAIACVAMMSCGGASNKEQKGQGTLVALAESDDSEGLIYIDIDGKRIISDPRFSRGERFSEGLAAVYDKVTGNIGFIDIKGNLVIPCELPNSHSWVSFNEKEIREECLFHCGYARVGSVDGCVLIDKKGRPVLGGFAPFDWDGDVAIVAKDDPRQLGLYTMDGKEILPVGSYSDMRFIGEGLLAVKDTKSANWAIMDKKGNLLKCDAEECQGLDFPFDQVGKFVEGCALVMVGNDDVLLAINKKGKVVKDFGESHDYMRTILKHGFDTRPIWIDRVLYDKDFKEITPLKEELKGFIFNQCYSDGMAMVANGLNGDSKRGYLDDRGDLAIPCNYIEVGDFNEGLAWVKDNEGWHVIDKKGNLKGTWNRTEYGSYAYLDQMGSFHSGHAVIEGKTLVDEDCNIIETPGITKIKGFHYSDDDNSRTSEDF